VFAIEGTEQSRWCGKTVVIGKALNVSQNAREKKIDKLIFYLSVHKNNKQKDYVR
jgi:hypothetical protein